MCIKIPDKVYFIKDSKSSYIYINSIKFFCAVVNIKLTIFCEKHTVKKYTLLMIFMKKESCKMKWEVNAVDCLKIFGF